MTPDEWSTVDQYLTERLVPVDPVLDGVLARNASAGLPAHDVAPNQGMLLHILARMVQARYILEIGTLGGYSTIWLARALPAGGKVVTLEANPMHAEVARSNVDQAGLSHAVEFHIAPALDTLRSLSTDHPFDLIFIDADKPNNPDYLSWAVRLSRPGTVIIGDNVVRNGAVADSASTDPNVQGVRTFLEMMGRNERLTTTALQTVGCKGWDGFAIALVNG